MTRMNLLSLIESAEGNVFYELFHYLVKGDNGETFYQCCDHPRSEGSSKISGSSCIIKDERYEMQLRDFKKDLEYFKCDKCECVSYNIKINGHIYKNNFKNHNK